MGAISKSTADRQELRDRPQSVRSCPLHDSLKAEAKPCGCLCRYFPAVDVRGGDGSLAAATDYGSLHLLQVLFPAAEEAAEAKRVRLTGEAWVSDLLFASWQGLRIHRSFITERSLVICEPCYEKKHISHIF